MRRRPAAEDSAESSASAENGQGALPSLCSVTAAMPGAVYSPFADRIANHPGPLAPLHVGDTWRDPIVCARAESMSSETIPRLHAYCDTRGVPSLIEAIQAKLRKKNRLDPANEEILVTAGATGGLSALVGAALSPGDEILILAPFWPLIRGIAQSFRATPVEVPFFDRVESCDEAIAAIESKLSPRSRVLYVSTPSNPTGQVIPTDWLEAIATLARRNNLWIFSDEVYEEYVYSGEHVSMAQFAPERTVSVFSFSKSYAMAGQRVGYLTGPQSIVDEARKIGTHIYYHAPVVGQHAALAALEQGDEWLAANRAADGEVGRRVAERLGLSPPSGGTFLFMDVRERLGERGLGGFLEDAFERGVLVAPGGSCGEAYSDWVRVSFTAAPPEIVLAAASELASI